MKTSVIKLVIFFVITSITFSTVTAQESFEKKVNKSFTTSDARTFELFNKFGDVSLKTWNKNEVSVEVTIHIENYPKSKAEEFLNLINVKVSESDTLITVSTSFDEKVQKALNNQSGNKKISVDYIINHPVYQKFILNNRYGNTTVEEINGKSTFNIKYGNFTASRMIFDDSKPFTTLNIEFGKAKISKTTWMQFSLKYADLVTDEATAMIIISRYSNISGGTVHSMVVDSKYDKYNLINIKNLIIDAKYSDISINELSKQLHLTLDYGNIKAKHVADTFEKIKIESKYSECDLLVDENACFQINASVDYGSIKIPQKANVTRNKGSFNESVEGWIGCKDGSSSVVEISGKYSEISFIK